MQFKKNDCSLERGARSEELPLYFTNCHPFSLISPQFLLLLLLLLLRLRLLLLLLLLLLFCLLSLSVAISKDCLTADCRMALFPTQDEAARLCRSRREEEEEEEERRKEKWDDEEWRLRMDGGRGWASQWQRQDAKIWTSKLVMTNQERGIPHNNWQSMSICIKRD